MLPPEEQNSRAASPNELTPTLAAEQIFFATSDISSSPSNTALSSNHDCNVLNRQGRLFFFQLTRCMQTDTKQKV